MSVYLAYSKYPDIRRSASSGGAVKSILLDLMESKRVDYVIITRMNGRSPETIITDKKEEILNNTNSIYQPTNPLSALNRLSKGKKYALVGLPCHIHNLKRLQGYGIAKEIIFTIALFCNHTPSKEWSDTITGESLSYRGEGSPFVNSLHNWPGEKYMPETCRNCYLSRISDEADICAGDPWYYKNNDIGEGKTLVKTNNTDFKSVVFEEVEDKTDKYPLKPRAKQIEIPVYWWTLERDIVNFGDYITPLIVREFGYKPVNFDPAKHKEQLYIIGSHPYQQKVKMKIWGAGCDSANPPLDFLKRSDVYALRGLHSSEKYGKYNIPLSDPGFLLPYLFPIKREPEDYTLFIPHHKQFNNPAPEGMEKVNIMVHRDKWFDLLRKIINAKKVYSSSLHAQIICKAYGVPFEIIGKTSIKFKDLEVEHNPLELLKVFPYPILNWRT